MHARWTPRSARALCLALVVGASILAVSPPASAANGPSQYCDTWAYTPYRSGDRVYGRGKMTCSAWPGTVGNWQLDVRVQRDRWWGWQTMSEYSKEMESGTLSLYAWYNCAGDGAYTWRTESHGSKTSQTPYDTFVRSGTYRFTC